MRDTMQAQSVVPKGEHMHTAASKAAHLHKLWLIVQHLLEVWYMPELINAAIPRAGAYEQ